MVTEESVPPGKSDLATGLRAAYEAGKAAAAFSTPLPGGRREEPSDRPPRDDGWHH